MSGEKKLLLSNINDENEQLRQEVNQLSKQVALLTGQLQSLEQKAQLYHQTVDNSPNPIFSINIQGIIQSWNPACSATFLYDEQMIGEQFRGLIADPGQLNFIIEKLRKMVPEEPLTNVDLSYRCKNGEIREMVSRIYAIHSNASIEGYVFANTDITERNRFLRELEDYQDSLEEIVEERTGKLRREVQDRREAQKALKSSNDSLVTILDTIDLEISVTDPSSQEVIFVNRHLNTIIEKEGPHYLRDRFRLSQQNKEQEPHPGASVQVSGGCRIDTSRIYHCQMVDRWYMIQDQPIQWVDGREVLLQVAKDITERKKIDQEHLRVAKLESLGMLAGGIAHDFNNLLTGILGNTSLLRIQSMDTGESKQLEGIERATFRAKDLTNQLLTFSKGGAPIRKLTSIANLIDEAVDFVLGGSAVSCEKNIAEDLWPSEVDAGQLTQVIHNIVFNAMQAMPDGGELRVSAENVELASAFDHSLLPGKYLQIVFRDTGKGIAQENLTKIFDPYFTTKESGSGLGLATTHTIIQKHQGHISAHSEGGAVFTILLPAIEGEHQFPETLSSQSTRLYGKILVMDDEKIIRQVMSGMLREIGCEVETARDGSSALDLYRRAMMANQPFDAVILDLTIRGGMGGQETLQNLKRMDDGVRAVVSSGYSTNPIMANYKDYGFCDVVTKPYRLEEMYDVMSRILTA